MLKKKKQPSAFAKKVYEIVQSIPKGKLATYGQVAAMAGKPRGAQAVGWILHDADQHEVPYQRVVNRLGGLARGYTNGGPLGHKKDLEREGITVRPDFSVDLEKYLWRP